MLRNIRDEKYFDIGTYEYFKSFFTNKSTDFMNIVHRCLSWILCNFVLTSSNLVIIECYYYYFLSHDCQTLCFHVNYFLFILY